MGFLGLHARANTAANAAQDVYDMRKYDLEKLKTVLDAQYPSLPYIISGDYNDDLDETVANVATTISTYNAFINDPSHYNLFTLGLSKAGAKSDVSFSDMIDHISGSDEMSSAFLTMRVGSPQTYIASYGTKTTDHYPVMAKFNLVNVPIYTIIPVELLTFDGYLLDNKNVQLHWTTATELNSDYFDIEKSTDGKNFFYIGKTKAAGRSNVKKAYNYADLDDSRDKTLYYRLKQVDTDGQFKYSKTISVNKNGQKTKWAVYPNPAKTTLNIDGSDDLKTARVYNSQGILVHISNQKAINVSDFSTGFYVLEVENTEAPASRRRWGRSHRSWARSC